MALAAIDEANAIGMLLHISDTIIANKPFLTELDSAIGDGDHGIGMAAGMEKVKQALASYKPAANAYLPFEKAGKAMLMSMGGASGVIFGSMFMAGAMGQPAKEELSAEDFAAMMETSLANIKERGHASVGDKTMVDALEPAVKAMRLSAEKGMPEMLAAGVIAAADGVESTKNLIAKFGRAKSLMERSIGHQDAGATSVWIILRSIQEYIDRH